MGSDSLTGKRKQKKKRGLTTKKEAKKCFNKAALRSSY
ncbi:Arm DNA-binding domain-containing protein [Bacillus cereus]|nr:MULTISPECIES: Arm DNA-binding domain-containing protein [Bacillus cereus group]MCU4996582.1 Arm DNA-binding domain-containing protein [Bacillus cereus]MDA2267081.1 Arm DNA-binding domain-containing protein [Bacillus cereus]MDC7777778.1 Arm DNA-binding domain-containing protein [Bacillus cereus]